MVKKTINYTNFDGETVSKEVMLNLTLNEILEINAKYQNGIVSEIETLRGSNSSQLPMAKMFANILAEAYGEKSDDGEYFHKSEELKNRFIQSAAFDELLRDSLTSADKAKELFDNLIINKLTEHKGKIGTIPNSKPVSPVSV